MEMSFESVLFYCIVLTVLVVLLIAWNIRLELRLRRLTGGKDGKSIEDGIFKLEKEIRDIQAGNAKIEGRLETIFSKIKQVVSRFETLRFNPFRGDGSGGNQSFISGFANDRGEGVLISGLYSREKISVYAKPLKDFSCEQNLSEEEKQVLQKLKTK